MKRRRAKIGCVALMLGVFIMSGQAQDRPVRIGFQASPVFSWVNNKDNLILRNGGSFGLKLGAMGDIHYKGPISFTLGVNLAFHEGGEFLYEIGGNYLPNSDLSDEMLQTGDKPLPDGVRIRYGMQFLEIPFGVKLRTNSSSETRYFLEAPMLAFSFLTRGRADIETSNATYQGENVYKDLGLINMLIGAGIGMEYDFSRNSSLIFGLYLQRGLFDFTRDDGWRAIENPEIIPMYLRQTDDSRATLGNLVFRIGVLL